MITYSKLNRVLFVSIVVTMLLTGCASDRDTSHYAQTIYRSEDMPEIVFWCFINYKDIADEGDVLYEMIFYDNKGNIYFSDDQEVCLSEYKAMIKDFADGKYDDKISLIGTCDIKELLKSYRKLCKLSKLENHEMVYPLEGNIAEGPKMRWAGIYYNRSGELEYMVLHEYSDEEDFGTSDERATQIYEWFEENIPNDKRPKRY